MGDIADREAFIAKLEEAGEAEVRFRLAKNVYGPPTSEKRIVVGHWLDDKESQREAARAELANSLAREANDLARSANDLASAANAISERAERRARSANRIAAAALAVAIATSAVMAYLQWGGATPPVPALPSAALSSQP